MDSILHYTDGTLTLVATASFVITFILGAWLGGRYGHHGAKLVIPALLLSAAACYVRSIYPPLSFAAISAVSVLHIAAGALTAMFVAKRSN